MAGNTPPVRAATVRPDLLTFAPEVLIPPVIGNRPAGLYLPLSAFINTGDATNRSLFTVRIKVKPSAQTAASPCIVTKKGYYAASYSDFPWDLRWQNGQTFNALHDSGNNFSGDYDLATAASYASGTWWDVISVHDVGNSIQKIWVAPIHSLGSGVQVTQAVGGLSSNGRNICVGRAPFEQSGGVNNSGFIGVVAHYEYWDSDKTSDATWLTSWTPPMTAGDPIPSGLVRYIPFDEGAGTNVAELVTSSTIGITNPTGATWDMTYTNP